MRQMLPVIKAGLFFKDRLKSIAISKPLVHNTQAVINNDVKVEELMSEAIDKNHNEVVERLKAVKQLLDDQSISKEDFEEIKKLLVEKLKNL